MATTYTAVAVDNADYTQLEPTQGFGLNRFGDPSTPPGIAIHDRGFGDPTTKFTASSIPATTYTGVTA